MPAAASKRSIRKPTPKPAERGARRFQQASSSWRSTQADKGRRRQAAPRRHAASLLGHQIVDRDLLRNRPLIDHFRLAFLGIDDQVTTLVLMVEVLAEGAWPEQRGLVVHFLELCYHRLGIRCLGALDGLRPDVDQDISRIDVLAGRIATGDVLVLLVELGDLRIGVVAIDRSLYRNVEV